MTINPITDLPYGFEHVGWFDNAGQKVPTRDPLLTVPCPICKHSFTRDDAQTHCLMSIGGLKSYFYRTHRTCAKDNTMAISELNEHIIESLP